MLTFIAGAISMLVFQVMLVLLIAMFCSAAPKRRNGLPPVCGRPTPPPPPPPRRLVYDGQFFRATGVPRGTEKRDVTWADIRDFETAVIEAEDRNG